MINREVKIGILATLTIAIFYFGSSYLKGKHLFNTDNIYYVVYDNSNGLKEASPVLYRGIIVGKIISTEITKEEIPQIKVAFSVKRDIKVTTTTEAQACSSILGSTCINLVMSGGDSLPNRSFIPGMIDIGLTDKIAPTIRSIDELLIVTNKFLMEIAKNTDKISAIFINLELITNKLSSILVNNEKNIASISNEISKLIILINDPQIGIKPMLININAMSKDLNSGIFKNYLERINNILLNLDILIDRTTKGENSLGKLSIDSEFYDNLNKTIVSTNSLMSDLKDHPWRYLNFSIFGGSKSSSKETAKA